MELKEEPSTAKSVATKKKRADRKGMHSEIPGVTDATETMETSHETFPRYNSFLFPGDGRIGMGVAHERASKFDLALDSFLQLKHGLDSPDVCLENIVVLAHFQFCTKPDIRCELLALDRVQAMPINEHCSHLLGRQVWGPVVLFLTIRAHHKADGTLLSPETHTDLDDFVRHLKHAVHFTKKAHKYARVLLHVAEKWKTHSTSLKVRVEHILQLLRRALHVEGKRATAGTTAKKAVDCVSTH